MTARAIKFVVGKTAKENLNMSRERAAGRVLANNLGEIALYVVVIFISSYDFGRFGANEVSKLAAAKRFAQPDWLANDWYLSLEATRYEAFNWLAGPLVSHLGFVDGAITGRLICYIAVGFAFYRLRNSLRLPWYWMLVALTLFLSRQAFVAGEWMTGGFEAKSLAYGALLLAIAAYSRAAFSVGAAWAGVAVSLHPLIGAYGALCLGGALVASSQIRSWRFVGLLFAQWPFVVTGAFGVTTIVAQLFATQDADVARATWLYVHFRNPHHLLPESWGMGNWKWVSMLMLGLLSSLAVVIAPNTGRIRFLAGFVASAAIIFCFGITAWLFDTPSVLKYYPFRLADTFIPLWLSLLAVWIIARNKALRRLLSGWPLQGFSRSWNTPMSTVTAGFLVVYSLTQIFFAIARAASPAASANLAFAPSPMFEWIAANTEPGAVLLVPPSESSVYLHAERATVATFKHAPHSSSGVIQWYERIKALNGGKSPRERGFGAVRELAAGYANLSESDVVSLSEKYAATHMLTTDGTAYPFEQLHVSDGWVLYRLGADAK